MTRLMLSDAAKAVDRRRSRSRQRKVGPSSIGVCRRRAGYEHHATLPSNPENLTGLAAIAGTWYHKGALEAMRREWGAWIEVALESVTVLGHCDALFLDHDTAARLVRGGIPIRSSTLAGVTGAYDQCTVEDLKTRRDARAVDYVRTRGPKTSELYQAHIYADLLRRGLVKPTKGQTYLARLGPIPVERVRLRYVARTGEEDAEYVHEQDYDPTVAAEAMEWVRQVHESPTPEALPRDQDGPGLATACDYCPFRTACWGEAGDVAPQAQLVVTDADLAGTLAAYDQASADESDAKARKALARAKIDGSDPAVYTPDGVAGFRLAWSGGRQKTDAEADVDVDAMVRLFTDAGLKVPRKPPGRTARSVRVVPWQDPDKACTKTPGCPLKRSHSGGCTTRTDYDAGLAVDLTGVDAAAAVVDQSPARTLYAVPGPDSVAGRG